MTTIYDRAKAAGAVMAFSFMAVVWELGFCISQNLSIGAFDDISLLAYILPPLTTVRLNSALLMGMSLKVLLQQSDVRDEPIQIFSRPSLVVRASTTPPIDLNILNERRIRFLYL